jgi:hypothetical protein
MVENSIHTIESSQEIVSFESFQNGGNVTVEKNFDPKDFAGNKKVARLLAQIMGDSVRVREHINANYTSNPELEINGRLADRKTPDYKKYKNIAVPIKSLTKKAHKQGAVHTVFELYTRYDLVSVAKGLADAFRHTPEMEIIDIILQDEKIARIERIHYETNIICKVLADNWLDTKNERAPQHTLPNLALSGSGT